MILVLLNYSIHCHANNTRYIPLRGSEYKDTIKVLIDIDAIKSANIKLIERKYLLEELVVKDSIILSYKELNDIQNKEIEDYKRKYTNICQFNEHLTKENIKVNKNVNTFKTSTVVLGGFTFAVTISLLLVILVK